MVKIMDLTGQGFGKWTVLRADESRPKYSICQCECGVIHSRKNAQMRWAEKQGIIQSCQSCAAARSGVTHGFTKFPEHKIWYGMKHRCTNPNNIFYPIYGGRGISVCDRWQSFENFFSDMGGRPTPKHSIDRINNDGNYEPNNCRWTTQKVQLRNTSVNHLLTFNGQTKCLSDWSEETGMSVSLIRQRIDLYGWSVEDALTIKSGKACNWRGTTHKDSELLTYNGESLPHSTWAKRLGISRDTIRNRLKRGWTVEKAVTTRGRG
jgi:hypothetical protein